jgi:1,4-dihydroxy-2-naphthoyl-CoA synthase
MAYETLRYEVAGRVATIALDTPDNRNALSDELLDELIAAFAAAGADDDVGCVVLTSTHDRVFSPGRWASPWPATSSWPRRRPSSGRPRSTWGRSRS